jgi:hypothetical protein
MLAAAGANQPRLRQVGVYSDARINSHLPELIGTLSIPDSATISCDGVRAEVPRS